MNAQEMLLKALGDKCQKCGSTEKLEMHHKDRNPKNNVLSNVILLCKKCHKREHYPPRELKINRRTITFQDDVLIKVEEWRRKQPKIPSFSKAVNTLLSKVDCE